MKPVQTGFPDDSDGRLVANNLAGGGGVHHFMSEHAARCYHDSGKNAANQDTALQAGIHHGTQATTLFAWSNAVSPHLAVEHEGRAVSDENILHALSSQIASYAAHRFEQGSSKPSNASSGAGSSYDGAAAKKLTLIEMAGGVCSPGPSGSLQVRVSHALEDIPVSSTRSCAQVAAFSHRHCTFRIFQLLPGRILC